MVRRLAGFAFITVLAVACSGSGGGGGGAGGDDLPDTCKDGKRSGSETGTDCGGPDCRPCPGGDGCLVGPDCQSGLCGEFGTCVHIPNVGNSCKTDADCDSPFRCAAGECGICRSCSQMMYGVGATKPACIGSQALFDTLLSCACAACKTECAELCATMAPEVGCNTCQFFKCEQAESACSDDI